MASVDDVALHAGNAWPAPDQVRLYTRVLTYVLADDRGVTIRRLAARLGLSTRLVRAVVEHQFEELQDDATAVLVQWQPRG